MSLHPWQHALLFISALLNDTLVVVFLLCHAILEIRKEYLLVVLIFRLMMMGVSSCVSGELPVHILSLFFIWVAYC